MKIAYVFLKIVYLVTFFSNIFLLTSKSEVGRYSSPSFSPKKKAKKLLSHSSASLIKKKLDSFNDMFPF